MAAIAEKIKELLGNGLSNEVVATAVGVHPSYISQLMSDDKFAEEVITLRSLSLAAATKRDKSWDSLEDTLLTKIHAQVDDGLVYKTNDIIKLMVLANRAVRRGAPAQEQLTQPKTVVTINLPVAMVNRYRTNATGEVVEVITADGKPQTLVTMPAAALLEKLSVERKDSSEYDKLRKFLPSKEAASDI